VARFAIKRCEAPKAAHGGDRDGSVEPIPEVDRAQAGLAVVDRMDPTAASTSFHAGWSTRRLGRADESRTKYEPARSRSNNGGATMLKKVAYVALLVSDQDKALDFYTNIVGLERYDRWRGY
jgi:Glyoxalase/Bleomycin resistance protein/Dioxygenase superfamily